MSAKSREPRRQRPKAIRPAKTRAVKAAPKPRARRNASKPDRIEAALAAFAHEVRTPLTGILAVSELLATSDLDARERRWVETIKAGAEHLAGLATLFVDAARNNRSKPGVRRELFDLRALASHVAEALEGRAAAKGLHSAVKISDRLPVWVIGDGIRLRAALENLIDNAVKFTDQGQVGFIATSQPEAAKGRVAIAFSVTDSGIGLSQTEIKRLFRPFSQANLSIAARFGGAGLGLSSARQTARSMGGDIVVTPQPGGGSVFTLTVTLQTAKGPIPLMPADELGGAAASASAPALRILSVEDNPFGRVVLNAILTELGHQTEFIPRGETAAERVAPGGFDAVLMDMVLPGISGVEAIKRIRRLPSPAGRIAIIGVSGRGEDEAASRAAGADAFLLKPVSPRALATALLAATRPSAAAI